jgi:putative phosphoribosyl transferase
LDVVLVRKLGVPFQPELAMGAIGEDGVRVVDADVVARCRISGGELQTVEAHEREELERRAREYRGSRSRVPLRGRTAVIVDDGIATGSTARAACAVVRAHDAASVVLAVRVAPPSAVQELAGVADEVIVVETPAWLNAIGQHYLDFSQTSDEEVVRLLRECAAERVAGE